MSTLQVGDKVRMPGTLWEVEVLEIGTCDDEDCQQAEIFRFKDPESDDPEADEDDWMHSSQFSKV